MHANAAPTVNRRPDDSNCHSGEILDRRDRTCVVGAGASGLTAIKNFLQAGFEVDCLEREEDLGGNWNAALPCSRVIASTHLISSKRLTEYVDHPMPEDWPEYPSHRLVLDYLRSYAEKHSLNDSIEFGEGVRRISAPFGAGDGWLVELESGQRRRYGRVVIANGHNWDHAFPKWSGRISDTPFCGLEVHSGEYKTPDKLAGKRVLVVGGGNSGCDIAVESSQHAEATRLSLRRGYHFLPKFFHGTPIDRCGERLLRWRVPIALRRLLARVAVFFLMGTRAGTGLPKPDHKLFETHPTINSQLVYQLRHGDLEVRPDVERLTATGARFVDGREESFDAIIYATGYRLSFPFVDNKLLNWREGRPDLYLNVFHPDRDDLFVVGMIQPDSGLWGLADRQARLVVEYLRRKDQGSASALAFEQRKQRNARRASIEYVDSTRHLIEVEHFSYRRALDREWRRIRRG